MVLIKLEVLWRGTAHVSFGVDRLTGELYTEAAICFRDNDSGKSHYYVHDDS